MPVSRKKVEDWLRKEVTGKHGESERRAVAQFVLDATDGNGPDDQSVVTWAVGIAQYLAEVADDTAGRLRALDPAGGDHG